MKRVLILVLGISALTQAALTQVGWAQDRQGEQDSATGQGDDRPDGWESSPALRRGAASLETALGQDGASVGFSQVLSTSVVLTDAVSIFGRFAYAFGARRQGEARQGFRAANPWLGAELSIGSIGLTVPVAPSPSPRADGQPAGVTELALSSALAIRGYWDSWLWLSDRAAVVYDLPQLGFRFQSKSAGRLEFDLDGGVAFLVATQSGPPPAMLDIQMALELKYGFEAFEIGVRPQTVFWTRGGATVSTEAFVGLDFDQVFGRLTYLIDFGGSRDLDGYSGNAGRFIIGGRF